jgi:hypothetical protein
LMERWARRRETEWENYSMALRTTHEYILYSLHSPLITPSVAPFNRSRERVPPKGFPFNVANGGFGGVALATELHIMHCMTRQKAGGPNIPSRKSRRLSCSSGIQRSICTPSARSALPLDVRHRMAIHVHTSDLTRFGGSVDMHSVCRSWPSWSQSRMWPIHRMFYQTMLILCASG